MDPKDIEAQARLELHNERFRGAVEQRKQELREQISRSWIWDWLPRISITWEVK